LALYTLTTMITMPYATLSESDGSDDDDDDEIAYLMSAEN